MSYVLINNLSTQMNVSKPRKRVKQTTLLTKVTNKVVLFYEILGARPKEYHDVKIKDHEIKKKYGHSIILEGWYLIFNNKT